MKKIFMRMIKFTINEMRKILADISKNRNLKLFKKDLGKNFHIVCPNLIDNFEDEDAKIFKGSKLNKKSLLFSFSKEE